MSTGLFPNVKDVAVEHPMAPRMVQMFELYKQIAAKTGKDQPLIKGASNITAAETLACAEMGVHHITILAPVLKELGEMKVAPNDVEKIQPKPMRAYFDDKKLSPRMMALMKVDPLAPKPEDFQLASIDVDYLANQGAKLEESIAQDPQTARRLKDALDLFVGAENECKVAIEKIMAEMGV
jgi:transaldolase